MKSKTTAAALTLTVLTALSVALNLVHGSTARTGQDGDVTPRTVVQAEPAPPCPFPYPAAICAPIPPAPLGGMVSDSEGALDEVAAEYAAAWNEIEVTR